MNVKEIVEKYLKENKYDGLAGDDCGCSFDDFMICESNMCQDCVPGYKNLCEGCIEISCNARDVVGYCMKNA